MISTLLVAFVYLFVFVFNLLLLARVIGSYVINHENRIYQGLVGLTEPVLAPVRAVLPQTPGMDLSPIVTFFLLQALQYLVQSVVPLNV